MSRKSQTADLIALIENLKDEVHSLKEQIKTLEEESLLRNKNQKKTKISQETQTNNLTPHILFAWNFILRDLNHLVVIALNGFIIDFPASCKNFVGGRHHATLLIICGLRPFF
jgi:hypothetical protein